MANPTWPGTLPKIAFVDNFTEAPEDANVEFPVEVGPPKRRRRISSPQRLVEANIVITTAQRAILLSFYESDCNGGTTYFDMSHPIDGGAAVAWGFREPPTFQLISGNIFTASLRLRKIP
jgi:hypothetical protein